MISSTLKESPKKIIGKVEETAQPVVSPLFKAARSLLLASIGALALSKDEIESMVNRLVEKGEITEKDGRKLVDDLVSRSKAVGHKVEKKTGEQVNKTTSKTEDVLNKRIEAILNTMNIPSKHDIAELTRKIDALSRKVGALDKKLSSETRKPVAKKAA